MEAVKLTINDYDQIIDIWKKSDLPIKEGWRDTKEQMEKQLSSGHVDLLGLRVEEKLVGIVMCSDDSRKGWINRLAVLPNYRKKGIGLKMIQAAEHYLSKKGLKIIAVTIEDYNRSSLRLFKNAGYEEFKGMHYLTKRESDKV